MLLLLIISQWEPQFLAPIDFKKIGGNIQRFQTLVTNGEIDKEIYSRQPYDMLLPLINSQFLAPIDFKKMEENTQLFQISVKNREIDKEI